MKFYVVKINCFCENSPDAEDLLCCHMSADTLDQELLSISLVDVHLPCGHLVPCPLLHDFDNLKGTIVKWIGHSVSTRTHINLDTVLI